jgi:adenylosuccinate synthase
MAATLIVGTQWGDEGKAKVIDYLAEKTDMVVRYQGGANAGHTVKVGGDSYVFHLIPSGILYQDCICILGGGMVIDPEALFVEIESLEKRGIEVRDRLRIADNAHILLPYHRKMDFFKEESAGDHKIGTTKRGIGICYADKVQRTGIRVGEILNDQFFKDRLPMLIAEKNRQLQLYDANENLDFKEVEMFLRSLAPKIKPFLINAPYYNNQSLSAGKNLLLEGAQGTMLDLDFGTYPFVTSSNPTTGGALSGSGISYKYIKEVIGITKAYTTRVGEGPFPTEESGEQGNYLRREGNEYGSTTGRPRRCGWFDVEIIRHAVRVNGLDSLALTKLDVLDKLKEIPVAVAYELDGKRLEYFPSHSIEKVKPVYEMFAGWDESIAHCRKMAELPKNARKYIQSLEKFCGVPIRWVSVGPDREETIVME